LGKLTTLSDAEKTKVLYTSAVSIVCVTFLWLVKKLNEKYHHKFPSRVPVPGEIITVSCHNLAEQRETRGNFVRLILVIFRSVVLTTMETKYGFI